MTNKKILTEYILKELTDDHELNELEKEVHETVDVEEILEQCEDCATHIPEYRVTTDVEVFLRR